MNTHGIRCESDLLVDVVTQTGQSAEWQQLVEEAQKAWAAGDQDRAGDNFFALQERATAYLRAIALRKGAGEWADECVADCFLALLSKVEGNEPILNVKALLAQIVRRRAIDIVRSSQGVQVAVADDAFWERHAEGSIDEADDYRAVDQRLTAQVVSNAILDGLSPEHRVLLLARYVDELTVSEAAARLGLTEDQVKKGCQQACRAARERAQSLGLLNDVA